MSVSCRNCLEWLKHNEEIMEFKCDSGVDTKTERRIQRLQLRSSWISKRKKIKEGKGRRKRYLSTCDNGRLKRWSNPPGNVLRMISWIGLDVGLGQTVRRWWKRRLIPHKGQRSCLPSALSATARRKHLTPRAPPTAACLDWGALPPRARRKQQRARGGGEAAEIRGRTGGEPRLTLSPVCFAWQRGFVCSPEPLVCSRVLAKCATSTSRRTAARGVHEEEEEGREGEGKKREESVVSLRRNPGAVCVYLAVAAAVRGRKSAALHWRDAIC